MEIKELIEKSNAFITEDRRLKDEIKVNDERKASEIQEALNKDVTYQKMSEVVKDIVNAGECLNIETIRKESVAEALHTFIGECLGMKKLKDKVEIKARYQNENGKFNEHDYNGFKIRITKKGLFRINDYNDRSRRYSAYDLIWYVLHNEDVIKKLINNTQSDYDKNRITIVLNFIKELIREDYNRRYENKVKDESMNIPLNMYLADLIKINLTQWRNNANFEDMYKVSIKEAILENRNITINLEYKDEKGNIRSYNVNYDYTNGGFNGDIGEDEIKLISLLAIKDKLLEGLLKFKEIIVNKNKVWEERKRQFDDILNPYMVLSCL